MSLDIKLQCMLTNQILVDPIARDIVHGEGD